MQKLNINQLAEVWNHQKHMLQAFPNLRKGQALFISLNQLFPEVAEDVSETEYDPFYDDEKIKGCVGHITQ